MLLKTTKGWWDSAIVGGSKIDLDELVSTRDTGFESLDPEAKQAVEKMLYEQRNKNLGIKSDEELKNEEIMRKIRENNADFDEK
jgi:hypothetical protein